MTDPTNTPAADPIISDPIINDPSLKVGVQLIKAGGELVVNLTLERRMPPPPAIAFDGEVFYRDNRGPWDEQAHCVLGGPVPAKVEAYVGATMMIVPEAIVRAFKPIVGVHGQRI
jgi:hypothetical protein